MTTFIAVLTTAGSKEEAENIVNRVVKERLAGCAQLIGPIFSTYRWRGKIEKNEEWLCLFKTKLSLYSRLDSTIRQIHSYETPEIIALEIVNGNSDYLKWLESEIRKPID